MLGVVEEVKTPVLASLARGAHGLGALGHQGDHLCHGRPPSATEDEPGQVFHQLTALLGVGLSVLGTGTQHVDLDAAGVQLLGDYLALATGSAHDVSPNRISGVRLSTLRLTMAVSMALLTDRQVGHDVSDGVVV
jgi:hypothetical protein